MEPLFFLFWFACAIGVGVLADSRGRTGFGWFLVAVVLSPLLAFILVLVCRDVKKEADANLREDRRHEEQMAALTRGAQTLTPPAPPIDIRSWGATQGSVAAAGLTAAHERPPGGPELVGTELEKLSALVDKGRLTIDEFNNQKARLLGKSAIAPVVPQARQTPDAKRIAELEDILSFPQRCVARLRAHGCKVEEPTPGVWEIRQPNGITTYARSPEVLKRLAMSFAMGETSA